MKLTFFSLTNLTTRATGYLKEAEGRENSLQTGQGRQERTQLGRGCQAETGSSLAKPAHGNFAMLQEAGSTDAHGIKRFVCLLTSNGQSRTKHVCLFDDKTGQNVIHYIVGHSIFRDLKDYLNLTSLLH